jgi:hypothetical protein
VLLHGKWGEGDFPDAKVFHIQEVQGYLQDVHYFLQHGKAQEGMSVAQKVESSEHGSKITGWRAVVTSLGGTLHFLGHHLATPL